MTSPGQGMNPPGTANANTYGAAQGRAPHISRCQGLREQTAVSSMNPNQAPRADTWHHRHSPVLATPTVAVLWGP